MGKVNNSNHRFPTRENLRKKQEQRKEEYEVMKSTFIKVIRDTYGIPPYRTDFCNILKTKFPDLLDEYSKTKSFKDPRTTIDSKEEIPSRSNSNENDFANSSGNEKSFMLEVLESFHERVTKSFSEAQKLLEETKRKKREAEESGAKLKSELLKKEAKKLRITDVQGKIDRRRKRCSDLNRDCNLIEMEVNRKKNILEQKQRELQSLENDLKTTEEVLKKQSREATAYSKEAQNLLEEAERKKEKAASAKRKAEENLETTSALLDIRKRIAEKSEEVLLKNEAKIARLDRIKEKISSRLQRIQDLNRDCNVLEAVVYKTERTLEQKQNESQKLENELNHREKVLKTWSQDLHNKEVALKVKSEELRKRESELEAKMVELKTKEERANQKQSKFDSKDKNREEESKDMDQLVREHEYSTRVIDERKVQIKSENIKHEPMD